MRRFLVEHSLHPDNLKSRQILLSPAESHHVKNVIRLKIGETCEIFDRAGNEYLGFVTGYQKDGICQIELVKPKADIQPAAKRLSISIAIALPQDRKMDFVVQKAVELGICEIIPMTTERTAFRIPKEKIRKVIERWNRIAEQAMKQSGNAAKLEIQTVMPIEDVWQKVKQYDLSVFFHPGDQSQPVSNLLPITNQHPEKSPLKILLMIGPEGGFSEKEVKRAQLENLPLVHMGDTLLKMDTAFVVAAGFFRMAYL